MNHKRTHGHGHHEGFTLVELLVSTALLGVLMVAVLGVMASLGDPRRRIAADAWATPPWHVAMIELIERDLLLAREVSVNDEGELMIEGLYSVDGPAMRQRHQPVQVRYRLEQTSHALMREQLMTQSRRGRLIERHLLALNVAALEFTLLVRDPETGQLIVRSQEDEEQAVPVAVSLAMVLSDETTLQKLVRLD